MANTLHSLPVHDGSKFSWHDGVGTCNVSDLDIIARVAGRVYADSCDVGFKVRSHRTGAEVLFLYEDALRDDDGDAIAFIYISCDGRWRVKIYND